MSITVATLNPLALECRLFDTSANENSTESLRVPWDYIADLLSDSAVKSLEMYFNGPKSHLTVGELKNIDLNNLLNTKKKPSKKIGREMFDVLRTISTMSAEELANEFTLNTERLIDKASAFKEFSKTADYKTLIRTLPGDMSSRHTIAYMLWNEFYK